jgi:alpha-ketoglutarate-dependent taurine dioxygenase
MFRNQKRLDSSKHRELIDRISALTGRPKENGIMKHALHQIYGDDAEVASLTPERLMMRYGFGGETSTKRQNHAAEWHRDMAFEPNPAALSSLRVEQLPLAGGGRS